MTFFQIREFKLGNREYFCIVLPMSVFGSVMCLAKNKKTKKRKVHIGV